MGYKISIIIPVYNAEKTIERCLKSILNQNTENVEIIVVNDGSTDNSENIILEIQKNSSIIKYYYKDNSGVADTRNYGIEKASGDYIAFVDSDDYISSNYIETISPFIDKGIEIIKYKLKKIDKNENELELVNGPTFEEKTGEEAFNELYSKDVLLDSPCVYAIKKDIIIRNGFKFQGTYHEDFGLIPIIVVAANSVVSISNYLYLYVQESNSITRNEDYNKTLIKMKDVFFHYDNMLEKIKTLKLDNMTVENIKIYYTNAIVLKLQELKENDKKNFIKEIKSRKMFKNIKVRNLKQFIKRYLLKFNVNLYLKIR